MKADARLAWASAPQGTWSAPQTVLQRSASFTAGNFVYAGTGHPHLHGADPVLPYLPSQFDNVPRVPRAQWYHLHLAKLMWVNQ